mgnify:CR=1 FL=1|tara:strand:- start:270 stop:740 length:471 start_codon:yes stop_codon:yes gene_type:complete
MKNVISYLKRYYLEIDPILIQAMQRWGHILERSLIALIFVWFGSLKVFGQTSATSIIAKSIYWFDPNIMVPILGAWEIAIGFTLAWSLTLRIAILLLFIRFPGTVLALFYHYEECFHGSILLPTIQGQYLLKELTLVGAAMIIGSSVRHMDKNLAA